MAYPDRSPRRLFSAPSPSLQRPNPRSGRCSNPFSDSLRSSRKFGGTEYWKGPGSEGDPDPMAPLRPRCRCVLRGRLVSAIRALSALTHQLHHDPSLLEGDACLVCEHVQFTFCILAKPLHQHVPVTLNYLQNLHPPLLTITFICLLEVG